MEEYAAEGGDPPALRNRPELPEHLVWIWDAFHALSSDRQLGMAGAGPIMFSSIDRYATRFGLDDEQYETLTDGIRSMDGVWFEHQARLAKRTKPP